MKFHRNIARFELINQGIERIWNSDVFDVLVAVTTTAEILTVTSIMQLRFGDYTAFAADVSIKGIG